MNGVSNSSGPGAGSSNRPQRTASDAPSNAERRGQPADPARQQAEQRNVRDRFAARLERGAGAADADRKSGASEGKNASLPQVRSRMDEFRDGQSDSGRGDGHPDQGFAASQPASGTANPAVGTAEAVLGPNTVDPAIMQRMAAQIAESWPSGAAQETLLQFPEGSPVETARLVREPDGSIAIRVAGLDPKLSAVRTARLQADLVNALAQRQLRIASLRFDRTQAGQRADDGGGRDAALPPAILRVV